MDDIGMKTCWLDNGGIVWYSTGKVNRPMITTFSDYVWFDWLKEKIDCYWIILE